MRGPAAPKDPVEKRPCLYVVLDKTISGSKDPEGVIRDYVYLEGRLKDQVKFTSGDIDEELVNAKKAVSVLGGTIEEVKKFQLPGTDIDRSLVYIKKVKPTSGKFPRKAGLPSKEPIV